MTEKHVQLCKLCWIMYERKVCSVMFDRCMRNSYVAFNSDCMCMRKNMFRFLLLKVPHVQFFGIIKAMLHSVVIVCV
jgi:hypothetical protein